MSDWKSLIRSSAVQIAGGLDSQAMLGESLGQLVQVAGPDNDSFALSQHASARLEHRVSQSTSQLYAIWYARVQLLKLYPHFLFRNCLECLVPHGFHSLPKVEDCSVFNIIYSDKIYSVEATNMDVGINASWCEEENLLP
jgi:hypothetical protein